MDIENRIKVEKDTAEVDEFNRMIEEALPLPVLISCKTYPTQENIDIENIEGFNRGEIGVQDYYENNDIIVLSNAYALDSRERLFKKGKPIYIQKKDYTFGILQPDLSYIKNNEEETRILQYEKGEQGENRVKVYRDKNGKPILSKTGMPIPIYKSKYFYPALEVTNVDRDTNKLKEIFQIYFTNPEKISIDGHSVTKHAFDAIIALRLTTAEEGIDNTYYTIEKRERWQNEKQRPLGYRYVLSTTEPITMLGEKLPEQLIHSQIATELANGIKERLDMGNAKEARRLANNTREWIKEFSKDEPILGLAIYNQMKYLLKYEYNTQFASERKYKVTDINTLFSQNEILETFNYTHNNISKELDNIFEYEKEENDTDLGELLAFESKVDRMLEFLEKEGVDMNTLDYLKLSAGLDRTVRPRVVLQARAKRDIRRGRDIFYPTTSIITSFLQEYGLNIFVKDFSKYSVSKQRNIDFLLDDARKSRDLLDHMYLNIGARWNEVKNIHLLEGKWIDKIREKVESLLDMSNEEIERFAKHAKGLNM